MKIIKVYKDENVYPVMVDDADYEWLKTYTWIWRNGYACTKFLGHYVGMHRLIMGRSRGDGILVDHRDRNHQNNQRANLRNSDRFQNQQNRSTNKNNTLPKGIRLLPSNKYNVRIQAYGQRKVVGTFDTLEEAIDERNRVAKHLHGDFYNASYPLDQYDTKTTNRTEQ